MAVSAVAASPAWIVVMTLPVAGLWTGNLLLVSLPERAKEEISGKLGAIL
jgi:hypothetical protein